MNEDVFEISISNLNWLSNSHEEVDLCCHGSVFVNIGGEIVSDESKVWTLSGTGLFLLRTLFEDYRSGHSSNFLLPCCAFTMWPDSDKPNRVLILGCMTGIDWDIEHLSGKVVRHTTFAGTQVNIALENYKNIILDFAEKVESFYAISKPKILPEDKHDRDGYVLFWEEWFRLKNKALLL